MSTLQYRLISEGRTSGARRWEMSRNMGTAVVAWLTNNGRCPEDTVRSHSIVKSGHVRYNTGGGYDIIDMDILGGNGSGEARRTFEDETGHTFEALEGQKPRDW